MIDNNSDGAAGSPEAPLADEMHKFVAPISGGRTLYFYTFGDEKLELPPNSIPADVSEASNV
jgi:hypothetical protein